MNKDEHMMGPEEVGGRKVLVKRAVLGQVKAPSVPSGVATVGLWMAAGCVGSKGVMDRWCQGVAKSASAKVENEVNAPSQCQILRKSFRRPEHKNPRK